MGRTGGRVADGGSVLDGPEGTFPGQFHSTHLILKQHPVSPATPLRVAPNPSPLLKPHDSDVMEVKLKDPDPLTCFYKKVNQTCSKVTEESEGSVDKICIVNHSDRKNHEM